MAHKNNGPIVFGIRHLSPNASNHLRKLLDVVKPTKMLVEGISDATPLIADIVHRQNTPPLAILAYTDTLPARVITTPLAGFSPEYQALKWAVSNKVESEFIDLPSDIFLALGMKKLDNSSDDTSYVEEADSDDSQEGLPISGDEVTRESCRYEKIAELAGESSYEDYWERAFEHNSVEGSYRLSANAFGAELRQLERDKDNAENLVREAFMRRCIQQAIKDGHQPEKIVVIVGAFHASVLGDEFPPMSDEDLAALPRLPTKLTLMPYSYFMLSSQSGYGAGSRAPAYFELIWQSLQSGNPAALAATYLTRIARDMREQGNPRSTASVIEAVRLAVSLSAFKDNAVPVLSDLHDAAITLLGLGDRDVVAQSLMRVDVGTAIGKLARGVSQTSIQHDFLGQLKVLKLEPYNTAVAKDLQLYIRENRRVKSEQAAFIDLNRSRFLHRLQVLGVSFAKQGRRNSDNSWAELWTLQWSSEAEIALVEAVLLGESIEVACAHHFRGQLEACENISEATNIMLRACECHIPSIIVNVLSKLQALACENSAFDQLAHAAGDLGQIIRFGDIRKVDHTPLEPILIQLFLQASLQLLSSANCDNNAAIQLMDALTVLDRIGQEHEELVDTGLLMTQLQALSNRDDLNPALSGYACGLLCERGIISDDLLGREVSRRLSPGINVELGAGWFEGLTKRNRYALLSRLALWEQLDNYIDSLDDDEYQRALVFLRRAFSEFGPSEKRGITENLGQIWGLNEDAVSEALGEALSVDESSTLDDLNDFDFDDL